ncbi:hypothetical protein Tco_0568462 [Tanacetum coccineum]
MLSGEPMMRRDHREQNVYPTGHRLRYDTRKRVTYVRNRAHDPDYVPEPIYTEYIPLEDEHEFPAEEQPLPPVDSPTTESPGYVAEYHGSERDPE